MKWKQWKLGLIVACVTGLFAGGVVAFVAPTIGWKELTFIILYNICQNGFLFLKDHPVDKIVSDTTIITKSSLLVFFVALLGFSGCARFGTYQVDNSYDKDTGKLVRSLRTRVGAQTFWDAKSELSKFSAAQTDKNQGAKVGSLNNSSTGTNALVILDKLIDLTKALPK